MVEGNIRQILSCIIPHVEAHGGLMCRGHLFYMPGVHNNAVAEQTLGCLLTLNHSHATHTHTHTHTHTLYLYTLTEWKQSLALTL